MPTFSDDQVNTINMNVHLVTVISNMSKPQHRSDLLNNRTRYYITRWTSQAINFTSTETQLLR